MAVLPPSLVYVVWRRYELHRVVFLEILQEDIQLMISTIECLPKSLHLAAPDVSFAVMD